MRRTRRNNGVLPFAVAAILNATPLGAQSTHEIVAPLPAPTGAFPVGTTTAYLTDKTRTDADFQAGRPVTLQLWYPAASAAGARAPYLMEQGLGSMLRRQQYYGIDSGTVAAWETLQTHSRLDGIPAEGKHPLVAFSVGLGVIRANYTSLGEELASHGYVVMLVESPLQGTMLLPGGREVVDTADRFGTAAGHRQGVSEWSGDISFALTRVQDRETSPITTRVAAAIDWTRVGAAGHSSGGVVAIAACERDVRVRACVNLDGGVAAPDQEPLADFVARGVTKPSLFLRSQPLYDDTTFARRGITREEWERRGEGGRLAFDAFTERSPGPLWVASVAGTGHFSFSDAPFVMPTAISRFGGRIIDPVRGWTILTTVLRTFFDRELTGQGEAVSSLAGRFPELTVVPPRFEARRQ